MDFWKKYICILDIFEPLPCFFFQFLTRRTLMNAVEEAILCDSWMLTGPGPSPDTQLFEASWVVEISFIPFHRKGPFTSIRGNLCWVIRWCDGPAFFGFVEFCKYLQIEVYFRLLLAHGLLQNRSVTNPQLPRVNQPISRLPFALSKMPNILALVCSESLGQVVSCPDVVPRNCVGARCWTTWFDVLLLSMVSRGIIDGLSSTCSFKALHMARSAPAIILKWSVAHPRGMIFTIWQS